MQIHSSIKRAVFIGSSSHTKGRGQHVIYSATKAAMCNMVQGMAENLGPHRVNVVNPPRTATAMRDGLSKEGLMSVKTVAEAVVQASVTSQTGQIIDLRKGIHE
jgi:2-C-methyl-D-erythritol 4-phosphate cytidylyltransferase